MPTKLSGAWWTQMMPDALWFVKTIAGAQLSNFVVKDCDGRLLAFGASQD